MLYEDVMTTTMHLQWIIHFVAGFWIAEILGLLQSLGLGVIFWLTQSQLCLVIVLTPHCFYTEL